MLGHHLLDLLILQFIRQESSHFRDTAHNKTALHERKHLRELVAETIDLHGQLSCGSEDDAARMAHRIVLLSIKIQTQLSRQVEKDGHQKGERFATSSLRLDKDILLFQNQGDSGCLNRRGAFNTISLK